MSKSKSPINPMPSLPAVPAVSMRTLHIAGMAVDVYGLAELPASTETVSVLWLQHPRLCTRADMAETAAVCISEYNSAAAVTTTRGLIAAAFDQRNHGSRLQSERANGSWRDGNATHAQDMFGTMAGAVADNRLLMDLLGGYADELFGGQPGTKITSPPIVQHLFLGVSLGAHAGWQLVLADPRVTAAVLVIGCPDFMALLADRARLSRRPSHQAAAAGTAPPFLGGSRDFPASLVDACCRHDPKGVLFGRDPIGTENDDNDDNDALHDALRRRLAGKRLLLCSGGADKLVPYAIGAPFLAALKRAAAAWPDLALAVDDRVYEGVKHDFTAAMLDDAKRFVVEAVAADVQKQRARM